MSEHIYKSHNKSLLLYHLVFPVKYRQKVLTKDIERTLVAVCQEISERYELFFIEIGLESDHVHLLVQGIPTMPVSTIARIIKSITAREIFRLHPSVKKILWGGKFWTSGYYVNTVGQYASEDAIIKYIQNQGKSNYEKIYENELGLDFS